MRETVAQLWSHEEQLFKPAIPHHLDRAHLELKPARMRDLSIGFPVPGKCVTLGIQSRIFDFAGEMCEHCGIGVRLHEIGPSFFKPPLCHSFQNTSFQRIPHLQHLACTSCYLRILRALFIDLRERTVVFHALPLRRHHRLRRHRGSI